MSDLILYSGIKVLGHGSKMHLVAVDVWQCLRLDGQFAVCRVINFHNEMCKFRFVVFALIFKIGHLIYKGLKPLYGGLP